MRNKAFRIENSIDKFFTETAISWVLEDLFLESENTNGSERLAKLNEIELIASESIPYIPIWISSQKAWSQNEVSKPIFNGAGIILMSDLEFINE